MRMLRRYYMINIKRKKNDFEIYEIRKQMKNFKDVLSNQLYIMVPI